MKHLNEQNVAAEDPFLDAYFIGIEGSSLDAAKAPIIPAIREREWMDEMVDRYPNRCLPMLMANQSGWLILNTHAFCATWNGGDTPNSIQLEFADSESVDPPKRSVVSIFGRGILTWQVPYLFRTPPGWNLLVRGPANLPKSGASALEGLVETDWATSTFTMNWKLTTAGQRVQFDVGEPICMIVPQRRSELEAFRPTMSTLWRKETPAQLRSQTLAWIGGRHRFMLKMLKPGTDESKQKWQRHYFRGQRTDGTKAPNHQTKRKLREFRIDGDERTG